LLFSKPKSSDVGVRDAIAMHDVWQYLLFTMLGVNAALPTIHVVSQSKEVIQQE
jgi:hypothetical protein